MSPETADRVKTVLLYALFLIVYIGVGGLLGSLVGLIVGIARQAEDDIVRGFLVGATFGLALGALIAWLGSFGAPPDTPPESDSPDPAPTPDQPGPSGNHDG